MFGILQMDGRVSGLNQTGRKMKIWQGSGITLLVNGMEMLMTKVTINYPLDKF